MAGGWKNRLAKAAGAQPVGQKLTRSGKAQLKVKRHKTPQSWIAFARWDVQKVRAVLREAHFNVNTLNIPRAQSTFGR